MEDENNIYKKSYILQFEVINHDPEKKAEKKYVTLTPYGYYQDKRATSEKHSLVKLLCSPLDYRPSKVISRGETVEITYNTDIE
jgi:hypothetical protein